MRLPQPIAQPRPEYCLRSTDEFRPRRRIAAQTAKRQTQITHCCATYSRSGEVRLARMPAIAVGKLGIAAWVPHHEGVSGITKNRNGEVGVGSHWNLSGSASSRPHLSTRRRD
jgi:hypothetical protein